MTTAVTPIPTGLSSVLGMRMIDPDHRQAAPAGVRVDTEVVGGIELVAVAGPLKVEIPRRFGFADSAQPRCRVHLAE